MGITSRVGSDDQNSKIWLCSALTVYRRMLLLLTFEQKVAYMSAIKQVKRLTQPTSTRVAFNMSEPQKWYKPRKGNRNREGSAFASPQCQPRTLWTWHWGLHVVCTDRAGIGAKHGESRQKWRHPRISENGHDLNPLRLYPICTLQTVKRWKLCQSFNMCDDITNDQLGISEETALWGRILPIYWILSCHPMVVLTNQVKCVTPHSSPTRGCWPWWPFLTFQYNFTRIICIQRFAI